MSQSPMVGSVSPQSERSVIYGSAEPIRLQRVTTETARPRARQVEVATTGPMTSGRSRSDAQAQTADPSAVVYSDEWWKRENDADSKLSQSTKICRC